MEQIIYDWIEWREPEIWVKLTCDESIKPIYEISSYGRIRNMYTGKILRPEVDKDGYLKFSLQPYIGNKKVKRFSHRLVGLQFIPNPKNKPEINHLRVSYINGRAKCEHDDNYYKNLEWCTRQENINHSVIHKLESDQPIGENTFTSKFSDDTVIYICSLMEIGCSNKYILRKLGFKSSKDENYSSFRGLLKTLRNRTAWHWITRYFNY